MANLDAVCWNCGCVQLDHKVCSVCKEPYDRAKSLPPAPTYATYLERLPHMGIVPIEGANGRGFTRKAEAK